ncbi:MULTISPECIES: RidA family protein [Inquilinus]|uniref:Reactive intermediate/imine deaminase n=1 Tax=Inquilinus ginsengisoli TaxID=363840 RepID=A0ABU1JRY7_9PROT|nr:RidA family protein [Inquilinus ginsengisoli]MDR6291381.1 reactive intermediate/imine deaminase [Inquilinus ginsengisoli]
MSKREHFGTTVTGAGGQKLPFSKAVRAGDFVYVSGQVPFDENGVVVAGGIEIQTHQTMKNVEAALALAGCTLADVIKVTAWLDDTRDFAAFNRTYDSYFTGDRPARSCVRADMMIDCKVEIEAIAFKPLS